MKTRIHIFIFCSAIFFAGSLHAQILKKEPPRGAIKEGQRVLVDDGTCPKGQIKELIGGNDNKNIKRQTRCIPR